MYGRAGYASQRRCSGLWLIVNGWSVGPSYAFCIGTTAASQLVTEYSGDLLWMQLENQCLERDPVWCVTYHRLHASVGSVTGTCT